MPPVRPLLWLEPGQAFPPVEQAWGASDPVPGLLAAGGTLDADTLLNAYQRGIFPWFSEDQPPLWWSPDPRMVLPPPAFRLHQSLRKQIRSAQRQGRLHIRIDSAFHRVIEACAQTPRKGQRGTWILPEMVRAYQTLHHHGHAHSVETWWDGELVGGLYCVSLGRMVFGESMFSHRPNASKMALAALVACCERWQVPLIDCQQNTAHLASLGAGEIPRSDFVHTVHTASLQPAPDWKLCPLYWNDWLADAGRAHPHCP